MGECEGWLFVNYRCDGNLNLILRFMVLLARNYAANGKPSSIGSWHTQIFSADCPFDFSPNFYELNNFNVIESYLCVSGHEN